MNRRRVPERQLDKEQLDEKLEEVYKEIFSMRGSLDRMKKPTGTKENPARSCKDLYFGHPKLPDGKSECFYSKIRASSKYIREKSSITPFQDFSVLFSLFQTLPIIISLVYYLLGLVLLVVWSYWVD